MSPSSSPRFTGYLEELRSELLDRVAPDEIDRIVEEAADHLEASYRELRHDGLDEEEAERRALRRFGTAKTVAAAYEQECPSVDRRTDRDSSNALYVVPGPRGSAPRNRLETIMSYLTRDLRHAMRQLARSPGFAVAFVLTLGLGIGANSAIFSVVNGVLLRPLPHRDGDRLVYLRQSAQLVGLDNVMFSVPEIIDYRDRVEAFDGIAEFSALTFTMLGLEEPRRVRAGIVTGNFFEVMGLDPARGRLISAEDDGEDADPVMVLTRDVWHRWFGDDPSILGTTVTMNERSVTIVGVLEPSPPYPERTDVYVNMVASPHHLGATMNHDRTHRMTEVFARLAPGTTIEGAARQVEAVTDRLHAEYPEAYDPSQGHAVSIVSLQEQLSRRARSTMLVLSGIAALVLLIACANVASLTLARTIRRRHELGVRASLGASPSRLRVQLLIENLVPALGGAFVGLLLAYSGVELLTRYASRFSVRAAEIGVDGTVLAVTLATAVAAACAFALIPRLPGAPALTGSPGRTTASVAGRRMQRILVVSQVALCSLLLVGAGLLLQTLVNLQRADGGIELESVLTMEIPPTLYGRTGDEGRSFYRGVLDELHVLPGVHNVALGSRVPLRGAPTGMSALLAAIEFRVEGSAAESGSAHPRADFRTVSTGYFETLGIPLRRGRGFRSSDTRDSAKVVIVNEALADYHFPDRDPVGKRIAWTGDIVRFGGVSDDWRTIVGVASDTNDFGLDRDPPQIVYQPLRQVPPMPFGAALFLRTPETSAVVGPATEIVRRLDPRQPIENVRTLEEVRDEAISPERLNAVLVGAFAALAVIIAAVGVAGVLAFSISTRRRELGIRAALGADRYSLVGMVLREGFVLAALGVALGLPAAVALSGVLRSLLFGVAPSDVPTYLGVAAILVLVALTAAWVPARRAARIDPVRALRVE